MAESFDSTNDWREDRAKESFNYLLLDPRDTKDMPNSMEVIGKFIFFVMLLIIFVPF